MSSLPRRSSRFSVTGASVIAALALATASWVYLFASEGASIAELFAARTWADAADFIGELLGLSENASDTPAFLDADRWREAGRLAYETLAMSVLAIGMATIGMLLTVVPAARTRDMGSLSRWRSLLRSAVFLAIRALYVFSRGVPELLWAMLIVFVLSPGILAGAVALAVHNFGILSKLCAEVVEDLDPRPSQALRATGAGGPQVLLYAVLPQVLPQFLTYTLYRWEVIIRTTIIVGFVAAGGLGREFRLSMSFFHYTDVALLLMTYFLLVVAVDLVSVGFRRMVR